MSALLLQLSKAFLTQLKIQVSTRKVMVEIPEQSVRMLDIKGDC